MALVTIRFLIFPGRQFTARTRLGLRFPDATGQPLPGGEEAFCIGGHAETHIALTTAKMLYEANAASGRNDHYRGQVDDDMSHNGKHPVLQNYYSV